MRLGGTTKVRAGVGLAWLARLGLGCILLFASLPKIRDPYDFLSSVYNYELVGPRLGLSVAMVLPWMELFVGLCLVGGILTSGALLACIGMTALFTFAVASALHRGLDISCGCFGASAGDRISYLTLLRAIVLLVLSLGAYLAIILIPRASEVAPSPDRARSRISARTWQ